MDLTEAEDIKKRWKEYTEELYKKDLHDPNNHNGVITHLEPDILECEVKWASESITMKKLVEVMEFQLSYLKSWKMMLWKCCTQYASKFGKLSSGHRTGKGQFSLKCQRKAMPKNTQNYTKKNLHDPDNNNGVITHLESDILESEVKWALGSITMNKAGGGRWWNSS